MCSAAFDSPAFSSVLRRTLELEDQSADEEEMKASRKMYWQESMQVTVYAVVEAKRAKIVRQRTRALGCPLRLYMRIG